MAECEACQSYITQYHANCPPEISLGYSFLGVGDRNNSKNQETGDLGSLSYLDGMPFSLPPGTMERVSGLGFQGKM